MKIGILTFHKAQNYGAFMQCYSLSNEIQKKFPEHQVEVIDYASYNLIHSYDKSFTETIFGSKTEINKPTFMLVIKRLIKSALTINNIKKQKATKEQRKENFNCVQKYLPLSSKSLISDDSIEFKRFIESINYDILVVGSDAIWNNNQTIWPNMYLLHDIDSAIKMSYAASTYGMDLYGLSTEQKHYVKQALEQMSYIGVRDTETEKYVNICGDNKLEAIHTCDPSIFLNIEKLPVSVSKLREKLISKGVDFTKPIVGFMCEDWLARKVRAKLGNNYQYVSVYYYTGCEDVFLDDLNPFEWSVVFSFFDATFTHFFHGTLFSIKNGTQTFSIERGSKYKSKYETKIQDVLKRLDLLDTCYYEDDKMDESDWASVVSKFKQNDKMKTKELYLSKIEKEAKCKNTFFDKLEEVINEKRK